MDIKRLLISEIEKRDILRQYNLLTEDVVPISAINIDKNYAEAYYNRGYTYELMNDFDNARKDYKMAMQIKTNYQKAIEGMNRLEKNK